MGFYSLNPHAFPGLGVRRPGPEPVCCHFHHRGSQVCRVPLDTSSKPSPLKWDNSHPGLGGGAKGLMRSWMFTHLFIQQTLMSISFVPDTVLTTGYNAGSQPDKGLNLTSSGWGREADNKSVPTEVITILQYLQSRENMEWCVMERLHFRQGQSGRTQ